MEIIKVLVYILHTAVAFGLIVTVTMSMAKHSSLGGAFGAGGANTVFGREKGLSGLSKVTLYLAIAFMVMSFVTSYVMSL
ncbi:MAG TPA: preprotein translocase subunit SecG [Thermotogota bacterium]|nr:preprotein translocase subunit SecG [Thermotogota bacterium]HPJ89201.1 preprotein translocase subunit SecG [Thermotogota bacterium]HPR96397.1 preprotein translocase subunit SecG [Thermotogota bacterium]